MVRRACTKPVEVLTTSSQVLHWCAEISIFFLGTGHTTDGVWHERVRDEDPAVRSRRVGRHPPLRSSLRPERRVLREPEPADGQRIESAIRRRVDERAANGAYRRDGADLVRVGALPISPSVNRSDRGPIHSA
jgi:hypothetical protein